jgi:hypothetical protein
MSDDPALRHFQEMRAQYFDALCRNLGLTVGETEIGRGFAWISAGWGAVRVFFEHERGLCSFSVGAMPDPKPLCTVEEIASRFPRTRQLAEGIQRLSLEEQRQFVEERWHTLQVLFSPEHLSETRKWRAAAAKADMERYTKKP